MYAGCPPSLNAERAGPISRPLPAQTRVGRLEMSEAPLLSEARSSAIPIQVASTVRRNVCGALCPREAAIPVEPPTALVAFPRLDCHRRPLLFFTRVLCRALDASRPTHAGGPALPYRRLSPGLPAHPRRHRQGACVCLRMYVTLQVAWSANRRCSTRESAQ